ncbi:MAG TPA: glycerophosphodiester phosphodiesterase family protein [Spirochaetota bacterium]|jgi:glycerophosphoryl diester phosphodiesterase|nr:MAG: putative glycerophosphoryl diester phosphodiesterase 1 [Spirochaetes bacterium ADurb.Bin133]HOF01869.1 glycerophosphodiester phosphodiesterase family protein [Spirochaetota bacterium]HOS33604.1 glycerophosphodiester phosphodiesterase family protein [Spirochaetota bacterium]HOS56737.1 glycerophosphodiester phosphodiesterase family protein [Spirochaetota bacterium]HPK62748.1 glycerophosphodiester phosphodiesterase family protein [Spirochaetota bacterium]
MKKVKILGHRGYRGKYTENSLTAFRKAFENGADGIECDIQKTKDNRYIVFHDDKIDRFSSNTGFIKDYTLEEIKKNVDLGNNETVPEIEEFLKIIPPDKLINIELKKETITIEDCADIYSIIMKYLDKKNILISSFEHSLLPYFKKKNIKIGMLVDENHLMPGLLKFIKSVISISPQFMNLPIEMFKRCGAAKSSIFLALLKLSGKKIVFWTVNEIEDYKKALKYAYAIITDDVEPFIKLRRE